MKINKLCTVDIVHAVRPVDSNDMPFPRDVCMSLVSSRK